MAVPRWCLSECVHAGLVASENSGGFVALCATEGSHRVLRQKRRDAETWSRLAGEEPGEQRTGHVPRCEFLAEARFLFSSRPAAAQASVGNSSFSLAWHLPLAPLSLLLQRPGAACMAACPPCAAEPLLQCRGLGFPDTTLFWEMLFSKTNWADGDIITLCFRKSNEKAISGYLWSHDCSALQGKYWGEVKWAKHVEGHFFVLLKSGTKECEDGLNSAEPADAQPSELNGKSYEFAEWELSAKTCRNTVAQVLVSEIRMA